MGKQFSFLSESQEQAPQIQHSIIYPDASEALKRYLDAIGQKYKSIQKPNKAYSVSLDRKVCISRKIRETLQVNENSMAFSLDSLIQDPILEEVRENRLKQDIKSIMAGFRYHVQAGNGREQYKPVVSYLKSGVLVRLRRT